MFYRVLIIISVILLILHFSFLSFGTYRTIITRMNPKQQVFLGGEIPTMLPDGFYRGSADGYQGSWQGKKFVAGEHRGVNVFLEDGVSVEKYPFALYVGVGVADKDLPVVAIDYNIKGNPWWIRPVLDEIVEVSPGKFLGKLEFRAVPWFPFSLGFFSLEK